MPKPDWYNTVYSGKGSGLLPRGREGTVTPKMQAGWLFHGAVHHPARLHKLRRKRKFKGRLSSVGLGKLRTAFEMVDEPILIPVESVISRNQLRPDDGLLVSLAEASKRKPQVKTTITKRTDKVGRPMGRKGGIPPRVGSSGGPPSTPERKRGDPLSRPLLPDYPPEVKAKIRQGKLSKALARHPANWQTTSPGAPVPPPKHLKPKKKGGDVSQSTMYQHMVRAIYNRGIRSGYNFKYSPAKSSQQIARRKMIQWKYSRRAKKAGGIPDRRRISLTPKGSTRSKVHAREPAGVLHAKSTDYARIVGQDPF